MNAAESDVWNQGKEDLIDIAVMREMLESLRNELGASVLTVRSLRFLQVCGYRLLSIFHPLCVILISP